MCYIWQPKNVIWVDYMVTVMQDNTDNMLRFVPPLHRIIIYKERHQVLSAVTENYCRIVSWISTNVSEAYAAFCRAEEQSKLRRIISISYPACNIVRNRTLSKTESRRKLLRERRWSRVRSKEEEEEMKQQEKKIKKRGRRNRRWQEEKRKNEEEEMVGIKEGGRNSK